MYFFGGFSTFKYVGYSIYNKADNGEISKLYFIKETQPPVTKAHAIQDTKIKNRLQFT